MTELAEPTAFEGALRAHYAAADVGPLAAHLRARIEADLSAAAAAAVRPSGRGWRLSLAAVAAAMALVAVALVASQRVSPQPSFGSTTSPTTPIASPSPASSVIRPGGPWLVAMAFTDASRGVIVGEDRGHRAVWRTADGGRTWTEALSDGDLFADVAAAGSVLLAVAENAESVTSLLRSDDGGATWARISAEPLWRISFADSEIGTGIRMAPNRPIEVVGTADGGLTWQAFSSQPCTAPKLQASILPADISSLDPTQWVLCTGESTVHWGTSQVIGFWTTNNGGATWSWHAQDLGPGAPGAFPALGDARDLVMTASGNGFALDAGGTVAVTANAGSTWTTAFAPQSADILDAPLPARIGNQTLVLLRPEGTNWMLYRTNDGGATWTHAQTAGLPAVQPEPAPTPAPATP
jgi:photosystem II stability/assembly factor-like uncharacterized protein